MFKILVILLGSFSLLGCSSPDTNPPQTDQNASVVSPPADEDLAKIKLPPGFRIDYYAKEVPSARSMTISPSGVVYVGSRSQDKVYALVDRNKDHKADEVIVIASGLNSPNGVAFKDGDLYVAEISRVIKFSNIERDLKNPPQPQLVSDIFPDDNRHGWKFIAFGPDGKLYVPVGAPCNNCISKEPVYASITRMNADGSNFEIFAEGIRNTVGFDWHPQTKELWFTDNGRDMMGDNIPPDELNRAPQIGMHFGYPYCHGGDIEDPDHGDKRSCSEFTPPVQKLGPHVAALGMRFYTGNMFPNKYKNQVFIAEHGSWNRSQPIGYRIMQVKLNGNNSTGYEVFAEGWLQDGDAWGRPVDVQELPDGSLLVSDDKNDAIYRISYQP